MTTGRIELPLAPYRVLDLTDERGLLCGKIFADLGADVIAIEPPDGNHARKIGPFYQNTPDPEKSLLWFAFSTGKRSVTLDIESAKGQQLFKKLVGTADFLVESFAPGYMERFGLDYANLSRINPRLIMGSITPFGQNGPYAHWEAPDIIPWAMSGYMWMTGEPGRAPLKISAPLQSYLHASAMTAAGLLLALHYRNKTGVGQYVDTSAQQCPTWMLTHTYAYWDMLKINLKRDGVLRHFGQAHLKTLWQCKDGYIVFMFAGGRIGAKGQRRIAQLMEEEGIAEDWLKKFNWDEWDAVTASQSEIDAISNEFSKYFKRHTKQELLAQAVKGEIMLGPVNTVADLTQSLQLRERDYWITLNHEELGAAITYPGAPCKMSETPWLTTRRAPLIGEHNGEIYQELGFSNSSVKPSEARIDNSGTNLENRRPLEGVKVVDFSTTVLGPTVTRYLTDHGATVIKVESISHPETTRISTPYAGRKQGVDRSGYFAVHNAGKLSVTLDMNQPKAKEAAKKLIKWADIVVETFSPGIMEKWGLTYENLRLINPGIIFASSSLEGHNGPYAAHRGYGVVSAAMTGWFELTGWPDGEPIGPYSAYADFIGYNYLLISLLSALDYRIRTGKGQYIDQSHVESAVHFLVPLLLDCNVNGRIVSRSGNRELCAAPHGAYRCRGEDRWCCIAVTSDNEWEAFCKVIGYPDWVKDPRFDTLRDRKDNEDELDKLVSEWTIGYTPEEVMTKLQQVRVPAGLVEMAEDLFRDPQLRYRKAFAALNHPEIGTYHITAAAFKLSKCPNDPRSPAPLLGEHNEYVLRNIIGMADDEVAELVMEGALQ